MTRRKDTERQAALPLPILAVVGVLVGGGGGWLATMPPTERANFVQDVGEQSEQALAQLKPEPRPYQPFSGCDDARAAGYENIRDDEPNYRADWDGDGDGLACEPHR